MARGFQIMDGDRRNAGSEFAGLVADIFAPLGPVVQGRMFSGHGFKLDGIQFAMILRDTLYLRVDEALAAELKAKGSKPFKYTTKVRSVTVASYYAVPEEYLDDADTVLEWARRAVATSKAKPLKKKARKKRRRRFGANSPPRWRVAVSPR